MALPPPTSQVPRVLVWFTAILAGLSSALDFLGRGPFAENGWVSTIAAWARSCQGPTDPPDDSARGPPTIADWLGPDHVNRILRANFSVMKALGASRVLRPFLEDSIRFGPLTETMAAVGLRDPLAVSRVLVQVGAGVVVAWTLHYLALGAYALAGAALAVFTAAGLVPRRGGGAAWLEALRDAVIWGSGYSWGGSWGPATR